MPKYNKYEIETHHIDANGGIYIGIPRERIYLPQFVDNRDMILSTLSKSGRHGGYFQSEGHRVDRNRDRIVEHFLEDKNKPEWLVMIDTDMEHPFEAPTRLTRWEKPIVGALYFHRGQTHDPFVFKDAPETTDRYGRKARQWQPMRDEVYQFLIDHNTPMRDGAVTVDKCNYSPLIECDAVATGCMAIHRSVLEHMPMPIFEYRPMGNSEDLVFCYEAKHKYGIPVYADLSTISGHYHWAPMGHAQFRVLHEQRGMGYSVYTPKEAGQYLSEYLGIPPKDGARMFADGNTHMVGDYWRSRKPKTAEDVSTFYKDEYTGNLYLVELLHWNLDNVFASIKGGLVSIRNTEVLEIGSGIGSIAIQLQMQNNNVVASEINEVLRGFINYRLEKLKPDIVYKHGSLNVVGEEWKTTSKDGQFSYVVAIDTFEHLHENEVPEMLKQIARVLKRGGKLITHNNWSQQNLYPMHYDYSDQWESWLEEAGFFMISAVEALKIK